MRATEWTRSDEVSVRRQVAARLEASILDGGLPPGHRLPGIRILARRLGLHRHTVAAVYRELADAGVVVTVPGSGTYVADPRGGSGQAPAERRHDPARSFRDFLGRQRAAGTGAEELSALFSRWCVQVSAGRLLLVEPEADLRRILLHELRRALPCRVEFLSALRLRRAPGSALNGVPVARPPVLAALLPRLVPGTEALPLQLSGGGRELALVRRLPPRSVVAVVTSSGAVRRRARELLMAETRLGTGLVLPSPDDAQSLSRALRIARLLFVDALCARMPGLRECRRKVEFRLLAPAAAAALRGWLAGPERRSAERGGTREGPGGTRHGAG